MNKFVAMLFSSVDLVVMSITTKGSILPFEIDATQLVVLWLKIKQYLYFCLDTSGKIGRKICECG